MVNVNFIGRLGADAEIKVNSNNGKEFLTMRVACNEHFGGNDETSWFSVKYDNGKVNNMKQYLTKGKLVEIHGIERVSTYTDRNGGTQIDRTVYADRIDFISTSKQDNGASSTTTATFTAQEAAKVAISRESEKVAAMAAATATINNNELPF